ncbi:alpha/beta fold hydrolase BchO [Sphingomonas sp. RB3P16]|uniref:alpha/beta fold hydrolase BchO n=1 Tax=Parasphingomonas frigoris TaxID=3096163 RepID=UPI002FC63CB0
MSRAAWSIEGRDWPNRSASRFVEAGRLRWHVQLLGEGPPLLLLHGTGAATHSWRDLAPMLAEHFTIVAPDLPGHGFTTGRPSGGLTMTGMAGAVASLLRALDIAPTAIVGHSAGAAIGARMILDGHTDPRALIGLNPALQPFPGLAAKLFPTLARGLFVNPFAPHVFAALARGPGEAGRFLTRATGSRLDAAGVDFYRRLFATSAQCEGAITMMASWDLDTLAHDLPRLDLPVLLVHGAKDSAIPRSSVEAAAAAVAGSRIEILPDVGHLAHEEQPAEVAALIRAFLEATV